MLGKEEIVYNGTLDHKYFKKKTKRRKRWKENLSRRKRMGVLTRTFTFCWNASRGFKLYSKRFRSDKMAESELKKSASGSIILQNLI